MKLADILDLLSYLRESDQVNREERMTLPNEETVRSVLRSALIPFEVTDKGLLVDNRGSQLLSYLASRKKSLSKETIDQVEGHSTRFLSWYADVEMREIRGSIIAARMGRPEKAAKRDMRPPVHVLFPIGFAGGPSRDLQVASGNSERISVDLAFRRCEKCGKIEYYKYCPTCGGETTALRYCSRCSIATEQDTCPSCERPTQGYRRKSIDMRILMANARNVVHVSPKVVKGVRGLLSREKLPERVEKGLLRSTFDISVFKDGTVRFDITNAPLTSFRPMDVGLSLESAQDLGYDVSSVEDEVTLKPQDIVVPRTAAEYLLKVSRFLDSLLERLYDLNAFYAADSIEDLLGALVVALSPHTSCGIVGRIVGFTESQVLYANPMWHAQKRRDCDGDQDSVMLLLDVLLNFSPRYLPGSMGGTMDAPLMISPVLLAAEVDSQAHNIEVASKYPLEFYQAAQEGRSASEVSGCVQWVYDLLHSDEQYSPIPYSFSGSQLQLTSNVSSYAKLRSMEDKMRFQIMLSNKLSSVDVKTVMKAVLQNHLLPDLIGNLRAFTTQSFRCKRCNASYRRPPLSNKCDICGSSLMQTVHPKMVTKYLVTARRLADDYVEDEYIKERLRLLEKELRMTLAHGDESQKSLSEYVE